MKLTKQSTATLALLPGKSEGIFWDDDLPGFGIRIRAGGSRTWVYQYKIGGQHRRITLGSSGAVSPARAREIAGEHHAKVRLGRDPSTEKTEGRARAAETMAAVLQNYLTFKRRKLRPRSYIEIERHLLQNARPLHSFHLAKINRRDIAGRISAFAAETSGTSANHMRAALSAFFAWAIGEGLIDSNPVMGTNRWEDQSRDRVLSDDELLTIWLTLGDDDYSVILKVLMLTGQRLNEIGGLRWSEIVGDAIVLPPSRCKNNRQHIIPLPASVRALLDGRARNGEFVFGRGRPFVRWFKAKAALDQRVKEAGSELQHWTHHDLRRTMATRMAEELGIAPHVIEAVLNHISGHKAGVAGVYNRATYTEEKKRALQRWASYIGEVVGGKPSAKVVQLRGA
jgi:integrase